MSSLECLEITDKLTELVEEMQTGCVSYEMLLEYYKKLAVLSDEYREVTDESFDFFTIPQVQAKACEVIQECLEDIDMGNHFAKPAEHLDKVKAEEAKLEMFLELLSEGATELRGLISVKLNALRSNALAHCYICADRLDRTFFYVTEQTLKQLQDRLDYWGATDFQFNEELLEMAKANTEKELRGEPLRSC